MAHLIRFEFVKFIKNRKIVWGFVIFGIFNLFFPMLYGKLLLTEKNGFLLIASVMNLLYPFAPFIIVTFGAVVFSLEYSYGTVYTIFTGKVSRQDFISTKIIFLLIFSVILTVEMIIFPTISASVMGKFRGIQVNGYTVVSSSTLWSIYLLTFLFITVSSFTYSLIGFFFGVLLKQTLPSILLSFVNVFILNIFTIIPGLRKFSFSTYSFHVLDYFVKASKGMLMSRNWISGFMMTHLVCIAIVLFCVYGLFKRREL